MSRILESSSTKYLTVKKQNTRFENAVPVLGMKLKRS